MNEEVNIFKSQCKLRQSIGSLLDRYRNELDSVWYELAGVKGIRYDTTPVQGSADPMQKAFRQHDLRARADFLKETIEHYQYISDKVDCVLGLMDEDIADAVRRIYIDKTYTEEEMSDELYLSLSTMKRKIIKGIETALERYRTL